MTHRLRRKPHKIKARYNILKTKGFWCVVVFVVIMSAVFYTAIFLEQFQVKAINISGNVKVSTSQIESLAIQQIKKTVLFFPTSSIFLVDTAKINRLILDTFPVVQETAVVKKFLSTININITERVPHAIFCLPGLSGAEDCFCIDDAGIASELYSGNENGFVVVRQVGASNGELGQRVMDASILENILKIQEGLASKYSVAVSSAEIASDVRLNIKTKEGWNVYLNLSGDMDLQITKLMLLLENEISKMDRGQLQYIDLRFKERAYYK